MKKRTNPLNQLAPTERARFTKQLRSLARARVLTDDEIANVTGGNIHDDPHGAGPPP